MGFSPRRMATEDDQKRLAAAEMRFLTRHNLESLSSFDGVSYGGGPTHWDSQRRGEIHPSEAAYLRHLWGAVARRALGGDGSEIAWGYVGEEV